jgi:hypothetical protein
LAFVGRIFVILFACLIASLAAGMLVTFALLTPDWTSLEVDPLDGGMVGIVAGFAAISFSAFAFLPTLIVIVVGEAVSIRSVLYYAVSGAGVGALMALNWRNWGTGADSFLRHDLEITVAACIVAGFVYWMIAGRNAGAWRQRKDAPERLPPPAA